jgi:hypothetical protein
MTKNAASAAHDTEKIAELLRRQQAALAKGISADGPGQQVMAGFADAYRAWLEAVSAKPESMMDLQGRYMQEQVRLWMESMQPHAPADEPAATSGSRLPSGTPPPCSAISATRTCSPRR